MTRHRPTLPQRALVALVAAAALGACHKKADRDPASTIPPVAQDTTVPGGETTTVPARTGSQSSGTLGSTTVIGAPPKGQPGLALAH